MVRPTIKIRFTGCPATSRRRFHLPYTFDQPDCTQAPRLHRLFLGGSSPACRPHFAHLGRSADRGGPGGRTTRSPAVTVETRAHPAARLGHRHSSPSRRRSRQPWRFHGFQSLCELLQGFREFLNGDFLVDRALRWSATRCQALVEGHVRDVCHTSLDRSRRGRSLRGRITSGRRVVTIDEKGQQDDR